MNPPRDTTIVDANQVDRAFDIHSNTVVLSLMTVENGAAPTAGTGNDAAGGAVRVNATTGMATATLSNLVMRDNAVLGTGPSDFGGAVAFGVHGSGTITGCVLENNTASGGGALAMSTKSTVSIISSALVGNTGEAIFTGGTLTVSNSTITDNSGSDIVNVAKGTANFDFVTLASNNVVGNAAVMVANGATFNVLASIFTSPGPNCQTSGSGTVVSGGYNVESGNSCAFASATHDLVNTDAALSPVADNGGHTLTVAYASTSPVRGIVAASAVNCPKQDQRGFGRSTFSVSCSPGAYELGAPADVSVAAAAVADVVAGADLVYHYTLTNNGTTPASGIIFSDTIPANTTVVSANIDGAAPTPCTIGATQVSCRLGSLAGPGTATITITLGTTVAGVVVHSSQLVVAEGDTSSASSATVVANVLAASGTSAGSSSGSGAGSSSGGGSSSGAGAGSAGGSAGTSSGSSSGAGGATAGASTAAVKKSGCGATPGSGAAWLCAVAIALTLRRKKARR